MRTDAVSRYCVSRASQEQMTAAGNILNAWIDETAWMPRVHSHQSVIDYYQTHVFRHCDVFVGVDSEHCVMGFLAIDTDDLITALYLARAARGRELGRQLLDHVKTERARDLSLWTFEANSGARAFYHREGFQEVRRTKGDNEEHLPDILYRWTAAGKPA